VWRLDNPIRHYAWGSRTAIAKLQGRSAPTAEPEAELWMGAHPGAPSRRIDAGGGSLLSAIEAAPHDALGADSLDRFGPRLPFLLKVLAAAEPLSLQAHPDANQACEGYDREQREGIALDAPQRSYRDPHDKPELVCALEPFAALCGFRALARTRALLDALAVPSLRASAEGLWAEDEGEGLAAVVGDFLTKAEPAPQVEAVVEACRREARREGPWQRTCAWVVRLGERYPGDAGVLVALLLELIELRPGEALFLGPGRLHCYLEGTAIEIMGSSDNVLRGGLTRKHVDAAELLRVLSFESGPASIVRPHEASSVEATYRTPSAAFALSRVELSAGQRWSATVSGPEIVLCVDGVAVLDDGVDAPLTLEAGASAFVPGSRASYEARASTGVTLFRATTGPSS